MSLILVLFIYLLPWGKFLLLFLKIIYLFIFRERGREGEREGAKQQCVVASYMPPTGDLAHNPGMCPELGIEPETLGLQTGAQSTEPHQPEMFLFFSSHYIVHDAARSVRTLRGL